MLDFFVHTWRIRWVRRGVYSVLLLMAIGGIIYAKGWYPLARVNGSYIWAYDYRASLQITNNFYEKMEQETHALLPQEDELKKVVFDGLVDDIIISQELHTQMSDEELAQKIKLQTDDMIGTPESKNRMLALTKMSELDAREYFLNRVARGQILANLFTLQQKEILPWFMQQRANARVSLWGISGVWNGEKGYSVK